MEKHKYHFKIIAIAYVFEDLKYCGNNYHSCKYNLYYKECLLFQKKLFKENDTGRSLKYHECFRLVNELNNIELSQNLRRRLSNLKIHVPIYVLNDAKYCQIDNISNHLISCNHMESYKKCGFFDKLLKPGKNKKRLKCKECLSSINNSK